MADVLGMSPWFDAVKGYRCGAAAKRLFGGVKWFPEPDPDMGPDEFVKGMLGFFGEEGLDWPLFWTADARAEARAVAEAMRAEGVPTVADVDDYFDGLPKGNIAHTSWVYNRPHEYRRLMAEADRVVVSTPFLQEKYGGVVAPNFVEPSDWDWPQRERRGCLILCAGAAGRLGDFEALRPALEAALKVDGVRVGFVNIMPEWALDYPVGKVAWCRWMPWEDPKWGPLYRRLMRWVAPDIVVSPLEHNDFNRAKSNLKWLESGMLGAAFLGEDWGELARTVKDGETGLLAASGAEWVDKLVALCEDTTLRSSIASAGRQAVLDGWTWPAVEAQWRKAWGV